MLTDRKLRGKWPWELALAASIFICVTVLFASEMGHQRLQAGYTSAVTEMRASSKLAELLGHVADAETGQRGFLLTKRDNYLDSYRAVQPKIAALSMELRDYFQRSADPQAQRDFAALVQLIGEKTSEMELTINLVREGKPETAGEITGSNIGKEKMDQIRSLVTSLQQRERARTAAMIVSTDFDRNLSRFAVALVVALNIVLLVLLFRRLRRGWEQEQRKQQDLLDEQARLDRLVAERSAQLETLAIHIQQVSENEKSALARELHDELGSILTASKMDVAWVRQHLAADQTALAEKLARALKNLDQGVQAKRRIIENLRPTSLTSFGLVVALNEYADQVREQNGWEMELDLPEDDFSLPEDASIALFRITQESLTNAAKYAKASHIRIRLACDGHTAELEIEDNGVGFVRSQARPKSHGLAGMRQRMMGLNGALEVDSEPGRGTLVRARLPLAVDAVADVTPAAGVVAAPVSATVTPPEPLGALPVR